MDDLSVFIPDPELPDGAVPITGFKLVEYIEQEDDVPKFKYTKSADTPYATILGLLLMAMNDLMREAQEDDD